MRIVFFLLIFIVLINRDSYSQLNNPKAWYLGYQAINRDTSTIDTGFYKNYGSTVLDFKTNPFSVYRKSNTLSIEYCNVILFDKKDSLILYSNGSKVFNSKHRLIEGADSLCYGKDWINNPYPNSYYSNYYISTFPNAMLGLQSIANPNQYYLISVFVSRDTIINYKLVYSIVDMSLNNGMGKMIKKEQVIKYGDFAPTITACKHGNGRDWWIIGREYNNTCYTVLKLDSSGLNIASNYQCNAWDLSERGSTKGSTMSKFSWNGGMYASFSHKGTELYDFNRCNGKLFNKREFIIPQNDSFISVGSGIFSQNDKFIYTCNPKYIYQIEISNLKTRLVGVWDGHIDSELNSQTSFGTFQLTPNGKIFINTNNTTKYLHLIESPNDTGVLCNLLQRSIKLLTPNRGITQFPNYELGVDGCWSSLSESEHSSIRIRPNPASSRIHIEGTSHETVIYNTLGQQVLVSREKDIDVSHLPVGVYHVLLSDRNGAVRKREKLIIQR